MPVQKSLETYRKLLVELISLHIVLPLFLLS